MKIESVTLREIRMPLVAFFETSFGRTEERRILLLEARAEGRSGWSEVTCGETPFYSHETTDTAAHILLDFALPMVLGQNLQARDVPQKLRLIRGHAMARAAVENALWAIEAECAGQPLWQTLGGSRAEIPCGVSIGIKNRPADLLEAIARELAAGYQRIKIKIKPGWDVEILEQVRGRFPDIALMGDANSAYTLRDLAHLRRFDDFHLMMLEQPLWDDDIYFHAQLQREIQTPICLDESIHSARDARQAIEIGACRIINIKLGRVGGYGMAREIEALTRQAGVPVWCGGMLESGIGRAHNIAMSTLENFSLPGDVSASQRYWKEDIIEPAVTVTPRGTIIAPTMPGLGFGVKRELIQKLTVWEKTLTAKK